MGDHPARIGIIGIGTMGKGLVYQSTITKGVRLSAVCDIDTDKACRVLREFQLDYEIADGPSYRAACPSKITVYRDGELLAKAKGIDAVVEASGSVLHGGRYSVQALASGKHLILMNSEADLIFGPYLKRLAEEHHVVYTSSGGDQYGVLKPLIDEICFWGFSLVMAGNIKGFLDRYANPTSIIPEADKRNLDYKACASFTDGTKLNIEMALIANALGLTALTPGMRGPACRDLEGLSEVFDFEALFLSRKPFVDYVLGANPGGGVFAVGYCDNPYQREMLKYYKMGDGPFYTFCRPYHLCHIEVLSSVLDAVKNRKPLLQPWAGFATNVYAYAKRDLQRGEPLDGIGGYACYGLIENCRDQGNFPGIPICLADGVVLKKDIRKDEKILFRDVSFDPGRPDFQLFALAMKEGAEI